MVVIIYSTNKSKRRGVYEKLKKTLMCLAIVVTSITLVVYSGGGTKKTFVKEGQNEEVFVEYKDDEVKKITIKITEDFEKGGLKLKKKLKLWRLWLSEL